MQLRIKLVKTARGLRDFKVPKRLSYCLQRTQENERVEGERKAIKD